MVSVNIGVLIFGAVVTFLAGLFCGRIKVTPKCDHEWSKQVAKGTLTGKYEGSSGVMVLYTCSKCNAKEAQLHAPGEIKNVSVVLAESYMGPKGSGPSS